LHKKSPKRKGKGAMIAHSPALFMIGVITLIALYHSALISNIQFLPLNKTGNTLLTSALFFPKSPAASLAALLADYTFFLKAARR
jgi:hypothetical protein